MSQNCFSKISPGSIKDSAVWRGGGGVYSSVCINVQKRTPVAAGDITMSTVLPRRVLLCQ